MPNRLADTVSFYDLLDRLSQRVGGPQLLEHCHRRMSWPERGVYFFFETGEVRGWSGSGPRVVRIGTHAITTGSRTMLWSRLNQHRGIDQSATANQRGSIFRKILGIALAKRDGISIPRSWNVSQSASGAAQRLGMSRQQVQQEEAALGRYVSRYIRRMPFLWVNVDDPPSPNSDRAFIERNAIALLSGYVARNSDTPTRQWLGQFSDREKVRRSGLWNNNHVNERYEPAFLDVLEQLIANTNRIGS